MNAHCVQMYANFMQDVTLRLRASFPQQGRCERPLHRQEAGCMGDD